MTVGQADRVEVRPLRPGARVRARDGEAGRLKFVVVDPDEGEVTNLIVERGRLLRRDVVVPVDWVSGSSEDTIEVNATLAELEALPEYRELEFVQPDPAFKPVSGHRPEETRIWVTHYLDQPAGKPRLAQRVRLGVQDDVVLLRRGLPVRPREGHAVGTLDHVWVAPGDNRVVCLVVRLRWPWRRDARLVAIDQVTDISDYGVRLALSEEELLKAPRYQPPATDAELTERLQRALDTDPRTSEAGVRVQVENGVVRFVGEFTAAVRAAARAIARRIRGVVGFEDELPPLPAPPLRLGAPVFARDGDYGTLARLVVDPHARKVTHLVVRHGGLLVEDRVIPIERVSRVEAGGVYLDASAAELDQYPPYQGDAFIEPLPGWQALAPYALSDVVFWAGPFVGVAPPYLPAVELTLPSGVPEGEEVLKRGTEVFYSGGLVGTFDHVLIDPASGAVSHLVIRERHERRPVVVPADWVREMRTDAIVLERWEPERTGVPTAAPRRPDAALEADVQGRLKDVPGAENVTARVEDGVVRLTGTVPTPEDKAAAEETARRTPGVVSVVNALSDDTALLAKVTAALSADPRTANIPIEVVADRGTVTLSGRVPSPQVKAAAEAIVRRVPGVVTVINELEVRRSRREIVPAPAAPALPRQ